MILKILKHEWKATYKIFALLYLGVILASIFIFGSLKIGVDWLEALSAVILSIGIIPVTMVYFVTVYNGYIKSMYGDESYLTHTLPVKARYILLSKWTMASFWGIATVFIGVLCGCWLLYMLADIPKGEIWKGVQYVLGMTGVGNIILIITMLIITCIQFLIKIYFAIAVSKLSVISRFQGFVSLVVFMIVSYIQNKIYYGFISILDMQYNNFEDMVFVTPAEALSYVVGSASVFHIIFTVTVGAIYFIATSYLIEKKLHIR